MVKQGFFAAQIVNGAEVQNFYRPDQHPAVVGEIVMQKAQISPVFRGKMEETQGRPVIQVKADMGNNRPETEKLNQHQAWYDKEQGFT